MGMTAILVVWPRAFEETFVSWPNEAPYEIRMLTTKMDGLYYKLNHKHRLRWLPNSTVTINNHLKLSSAAEASKRIAISRILEALYYESSERQNLFSPYYIQFCLHNKNVNI